MIGDNYYVYCIASNALYNDSTTITGHQNEPIFGVHYKNLVAYVSKTTVTYMETSLENLQCHENVLSEVMKIDDVLPMSFSTIYKSEENIILMLEKYYDQFEENLEKVSGKIELGIKVFYKLNFEEEDKSDKEIIKSPKEYMMKRYERYCSRQKQIDRLLSVIGDFHKVFSDIAVDNCFTKPLKNNLVFNASYLVVKNRKAEFDKAVEEIKEKNQAYKILYSGPWPAYHFIKIVQEGEEDE